MIATQTMIRRSWIVGGCLVGLIAGCGDATDGEQTAPPKAAQTEMEVDEAGEKVHGDHLMAHRVTLADREAVEDRFSGDGVAHFRQDEPFEQIGWRLQAEWTHDLAYRVRSKQGDWSPWNEIEPYWNKHDLHNAHVVLDEPAVELQMKGADTLRFAVVDFFEEAVARKEVIGVDDDGRDDRGESDDDLATVYQAVAPDSMVTTRHQWGAFDPDRICNNVVAPYRMSIHHTASPDSDGADVHATMQGMQNYHINTNNWCDIGYHFVVAQSGEILQGRSRSNRPGAHVGGQNSGNVGISMIGNYTSVEPPQVQLDHVVEMVRWVHDEHGVTLNRDQVRGHREWPGQTTTCPGDVALGQLNWIVDQAAQDPDPPEPDPEYDANLDVIVHDLDDFYTQGDSESVPDALPGDEFTAEIRLTNLSDEAVQDVSLGYDFDAVGLEATDYRIESDHPVYDQQTWELNSADDEPANPDGGDLGSSGDLEMHAFSPQETKRVVIDFDVVEYSIGLDEVQGIRAWLRNVANVYGVQGDYGQNPDVNQIGGRVEHAARIDVLSQSEWQFRTGASDELEGWTGGGDYETLHINTDDHRLSQKIDGDDAYVVSPHWTQLDADSYDELVLEQRSHNGEHTKAVYWAGEGEDFSTDRSVRFEAVGDGQPRRLVVPVGEHPKWAGDIDRLKMRLSDDEAPGSDDSPWFGIDSVYFQHYGADITTSDSLGVVDDEPVEVDIPGHDDSGQHDDDSSQHEDDSSQDPDSEAGPKSNSGFPGATDDSHIETNQGCTTAAGGIPPLVVFVLLLVLGWINTRRRQPAAKPSSWARFSNRV